MTDEDIKKALVCCCCGVTKCVCNECPIRYRESCLDDLPKIALDLINRQQAEIERLNGNLFTISDACMQRRNEAIKEFAERLRKEAVTKCDWDNCVDVEDIDRLVQEMAGEQDA